MKQKSKESVLFLSGVLILSLYVFDVLAKDTTEINFALGRPVTASKSESVGPPSRVVDGNLESVWNSGDYAPQWIEIDLESEIPLTCASLLVDQKPSSGNTRHVITGRNCAAEEFTLAIIEEYTSHLELLHVEFQDPVAVRWVRITTTQSPSWVAWYEIELYAPSSVPIRHHTWSNIKSFYESGAD